jgi:hypothetical protein
MIEASFHVFRWNAKRSQSCCQRAAKVVSSRPIFRPGCRSFGVFWFKLSRIAFVLWAKCIAKPRHGSRERMAIDRPSKMRSPLQSIRIGRVPFFAHHLLVRLLASLEKIRFDFMRTVFSASICR